MKHFIAAATLVTLASTPTLAQTYQQGPEEGLYLGVGLGSAKLNNEIFDNLDDWGADTDDSDISYKMFAGYQFNPNFAVEASYLNFGEFTASASDGANNARLDLGMEGFGFALVGKLPIAGGFGVYGKLGMLAWDGDLSGDITLDGQRYQGFFSEDGTDPFYGLGAEYVVNQFMLRGEYERYAISDDSGEDFKTDMISASIGYRF